VGGDGHFRVDPGVLVFVFVRVAHAVLLPGVGLGLPYPAPRDLSNPGQNPSSRRGGIWRDTGEML
ncbi:MAG: hypothetical protein ACPL7R_10220, partial [Anaerolineae bacterium]